MKWQKKTLAIVLTVLTLILATFPAGAAVTEPQTEEYLPEIAFDSEAVLDDGSIQRSVMDEILAEHQKAIWDFTMDADGRATALTRKSTSIAQIQEDTLQALQHAGYEAYDVNPGSFDEMETILETDLEEAGLSPEGSYIVIIGGEEDPTAIAPANAVSSPFSHTYGGKTYTLRWMTIKASDDPRLGQSTVVNLLDSTSRNLLINALDTVLSTYISSISAGLGTVASIFGLSVADFFPNSRTTLNFIGSSSWTVRYTQVWSPQDNRYTNGCYVEEVDAYSSLSGYYYSAGLNRYTDFPPRPRLITSYSSKFNDWSWRKDYAVIGYLNSTVYKNSVDKVEFRYGGVTKITHKHS